MRFRHDPWFLSSKMNFYFAWTPSICLEMPAFEAVEASNADEAIAILEANLNIHVVFTDVQMPGSMDGLKLAKFVKNRWPPIKIIATSGRLRISSDDLPEGGRFLPKPYTPDEVISTLRELTAD
jgi:CheY-like chemotaxis protein